MRLPQALRSVARDRGLSAGVILTIATGVAIFATTFGVVNAALFRPPPFPEAGRIAMLYLDRNPRGEAPRRERWSFARFEMLRATQTTFDHVASYSPAAHTISDDGGAELSNGERVSPSYFQLLHARAVVGRLFSDVEDDAAQPTPVVVLGHGLWTRRWGADSAIVGRMIRINGVALTVIGIMAPGFTGLSGRAEHWIPRTMTPQTTYAEYLTTNQNFISAVGRLRVGVSMDAARAELAVLGGNVNRALPSDPDYPDERVAASAVTLNDARTNNTVRRSLLVLLGAVAALHLLACANVTNLLLGRAAARRRDAAVRVALGSSAVRLFGHVFREGLVLAGFGGALGVVVAWRVSAFISPPANVWAPRNFYGSIAPFDAPAFGASEWLFAMVIAAVTAAAVAALPALSALRVDVASGIKAGARGVPGGALTLRRPSARGVIVGLEAALAMLLLVAAGLLIDSFRSMRGVDIGVDPANVLTFWVIPSEVRVPVDAAPVFVSRVLDAVRAVPGVRSASVDGGAPLAGTASSVLYIDGRPEPAPGQAPPVLRHYVAPDHFTTLGVPVRRGRAFTPADDANAPRVTVISETAARQFWPHEDPIGRRVWFGSGSTFNSRESSAEIVGIVGDVVYAPLDQRPNFASFYTPYTQFTYASRAVFVKTARDPMAMVPSIRQAIATVDPELPMRDVQPLADVVTGSWTRNRFDAMLFGGFGLAALVLAASGIFAVLSYTVASRAREFGVRIALGATTGRVVWNVVREGLAFPVIGLLAGVGASLAFTRVLESSLYGVSPREPRVFVGTMVLLIMAAVAACVIPAWRASRSDPMEALRAD
jgi:putative ABC transport system permease protein